MDVCNILIPLALGLLSYYAAHFIGAPLLEFRTIRREIHQKIREHLNITTPPEEKPEKERKYHEQRNKKAAEEYRMLSAKLAAFHESLNGRSFWIAKNYLLKLKKYDLKKASENLIKLETHAIVIDHALQKEALSELEEALKISSQIA